MVSERGSLAQAEKQHSTATWKYLYMCQCETHSLTKKEKTICVQSTRRMADNNNNNKIHITTHVKWIRSHKKRQPRLGIGPVSSRRNMRYFRDWQYIDAVNWWIIATCWLPLSIFLLEWMALRWRWQCGSELDGGRRVTEKRKTDFFLLLSFVTVTFLAQNHFQIQIKMKERSSVCVYYEWMKPESQ